jgi:membrane protein DedA with SNARE-associated domain
LLDGLTQFARDAVTAAGYPGIAGVMVLETVFPPIPSEIVLPLAGYEVQRGGLSFVGVVLVATLGSLIGAYVLYALGRWGGRPAVLRFGRVLRVGERELDRADRWFGRWGDRVVLVGRIVPLARSVVSIPAGTMRMPLLRFTVLTGLGSLLWNLVLVGAGYQLGARWEEVSRLVSRYSTVVYGVFAVALVAGAIWLLRRRRPAR